VLSVFMMIDIGFNASLWLLFACKLARSWLRLWVALLLAVALAPVVALEALSVLLASA
jgi:hypothetical protein